MKSRLLLTALVCVAAAGCSLMPASQTQQPRTVTARPAAPLDLHLAENMVELPPEPPAKADDTDLWDRLRNNFALDLDHKDHRVQAQRNWYVRHPAYLDRVATRAQRYLHHIVAEAEERGIPGELALLPVVESAFDPFAFSHGRAAGPWQFIPGTGDHFGLKRNYWYDGRRDILASTDAAFDYLEQLAARFDGNWLLALASYNAGGGNVARAIRINKRQGRPTDFWHLRHLPRETRTYVPKLIAIAQLVAQPEQYGIELPPIADQPYFRVVEVEQQISLRKAAEMAGVSREELHLLNPGLNRWATPPQGPHRLLLPVQHVKDFRTALRENPEKARTAWRPYRIRRGDSLIGIARRFGTTPSVLREENDLRGNTIVAGETLRVPSPEGKARAPAPRTVKVRRGDTLWEIARDHDMSVNQLARRNNLSRGTALQPGQELVVNADARTSSSAGEGIPDMVRKVRYAVRRGDSLYHIARRFNVSISQIQRWNGISRNNYLHPGQRLTLYVDIRNTY